MVSSEYSIAFSETLDILNHTQKEDVEKIPSKFLNFLKINASKNYESKLDFNKSIRDMNLNPKTIGILSIIHKKYWCNCEQKKTFEEKLKQNELEYQKELKEKYNLDNIFINKDIEKQKEENCLMVIEKEKWYNKIFNKIKSLFIKKNTY